jgi:hypothetical protein
VVLREFVTLPEDLKMTAPKKGFAFISYRRDDVAAEARALSDAIDSALGEDSTFFDTGPPLGEE